MKKIISVLFLTVIVFSLSACNRGDDDRPIVYATVYPVMFVAETIAGDTVNVERVPGSNVHSDSYDWSAKEIISMKNAEYIFYVGANSDNYIPDNKETIFDEGDVELVHIGDYVTYEKTCYEHEHTHDEDHVEETTEEPHEEECSEAQLVDDPHFWLDPDNMIIVAEMVKDKLVASFPENEELYLSNYNTLVQELEELDADYEAMALEATKPIITTNMLFNYWHNAYDIEILSLIADAHTSSTVPEDIIHFVEEAILHDIHFILYEKNSNSPTGDAVLAELLLQDSTATTRELHGLGTLNAMEVEDGEDYISLMYQNLEILKEVTK